MNNIKIAVITNNNLFRCGIIKKVDDKLINKLLSAPPLDYPIDVIIYKNEHSKQVHFVNNQGRKYEVKDGTRKFYFNEFYNKLVKIAKKEAEKHGN